MSKAIEPEMTEAEKLQAFLDGVNALSEQYGYRMEARIAPVPNSAFVQAEIAAVKING